MPHPAEVCWVTRNWYVEGAHSLDVFRAHGGYRAWEKALRDLAPDDITQMVKASGLRGRGGAGFSTGAKWAYVPKDPSRPKYLVCNADESEPGTFKDRYIMDRDPHLLLEGIAISSYAIGAHQAFIYVRGELEFCSRRLEAAIAEATEAGLLGRSILGTSYDLDVMVHRGAGAYICGEESALLNSLEGLRGNPRLKPPFPATHGVYQCPTVVNNVETLANVPLIVMNGAEWFTSVGTAESPGTKILGVSGRVKRPGNYELPMGTPLDFLIEDCCNGMQPGYGIKAIIPGGSSVPLLPAEKVGTRLDFESVRAAGSMLGCGAVIVIDDRTCIVKAAQVLTRFYRHESCGFCVPCREGTNWMLGTITAIEEGRGQSGDADLLIEMCEAILGRSFCPLGDAAATPVQSAIELFRDEWEYHIEHGRCLVGGVPASAG